MTATASISSEYHVVPADPILNLLSVTQLIGISGGKLTVGGNTLVVPSGAVTLPTLFTMVQLPTPYIRADLTAITSTLLGLLNIGEKGFAKPVTLTLSYRNAIGVTDPTRLRIAEMKANGEIGVVLPTTVNATTKTVTAKLPHFSSWVVVCD
jgi:hypothetical protein